MHSASLLVARRAFCSSASGFLGGWDGRLAEIITVVGDRPVASPLRQTMARQNQGRPWRTPRQDVLPQPVVLPQEQGVPPSVATMKTTKTSQCHESWPSQNQRVSLRGRSRRRRGRRSSRAGVETATMQSRVDVVTAKKTTRSRTPPSRREPPAFLGSARPRDVVWCWHGTRPPLHIPRGAQVILRA